MFPIVNYGSSYIIIITVLYEWVERVRCVQKIVIIFIIIKLCFLTISGESTLIDWKIFYCLMNWKRFLSDQYISMMNEWIKRQIPSYICVEGLALISTFKRMNFKNCSFVIIFYICLIWIVHVLCCKIHVNLNVQKFDSVISWSNRFMPFSIIFLLFKIPICNSNKNKRVANNNEKIYNKKI